MKKFLFILPLIFFSLFFSCDFDELERKPFSGELESIYYVERYSSNSYCNIYEFKCEYLSNSHYLVDSYKIHCFSSYKYKNLGTDELIKLIKDNSISPISISERKTTDSYSTSRLDYLSNHYVYLFFDGEIKYEIITY